MSISLPRSLSSTIPPLKSSQTIPIPIPQPVTPLNLPSEPLSYDEESDIFDNVTLSLIFPGDIKHQMMVKSGETIQEIKRRISVQNGMTYTSISLCFNDHSLIDPLSLNDVKGLVINSSAKLEVKISVNNAIEEITTPLANIVVSEPPTTNTVILDINTNIIQTYTNLVEVIESPQDQNTENQYTSITLPNSPESPEPVKKQEKDGSTNIDTYNNSNTKDTIGCDSEAQFNAIKQLGSTNKSRWKLCFLF